MIYNKNKAMEIGVIGECGFMNKQSVKAILKTKGVYFSARPPSYRSLQRVFACSGPFMVICDRKLLILPEVKKWLKPYLVYKVSAGEKLKDTQCFSQHISGVIKASKGQTIAGFISLGGGSVGDFTGFLGSVYKRGRPVVHIPSTYLSAVDSAHGGKTALNHFYKNKLIKNFIGSYHFPRAVFIVKEWLRSVPEKQKTFAEGEFFKMAFIAGGELYTELFKSSAKTLWSVLPLAILAKLKITQQDPYEKKGLRWQLNLGHTMGHVLESYFRLPHGKAVLYGLVFTLRWSDYRFSFSSTFLKEVSFLLKKPLSFYLKKIPLSQLEKLIEQDKKQINKKSMRFVFVKGPGQIVVEPVSVKKIIQEVKRQKSLG